MKKYTYNEKKINLEAWTYVMDAIKEETDKLIAKPGNLSEYDWYTDDNRLHDQAVSTAADRLFEAILAAIDPADF